MVASAKGRPPQFLRRVQNRPAIRRRSNLFVFLQLLLVASGLAVGGLAAWGGYHWVHNNQIFRLQRLSLDTVPAHLLPAVRTGLEPLRGANLLLVDLDAIQRRLETVPQVESARVRRTLPDTIEVELETRPAWGVIRGIDGMIEISADGVVLGPAIDSGDLPRILLDAEIETIVGSDGRLAADLPGAARLAAAVATDAWLRANDPRAFGILDHYRLEPDGLVLVVDGGRWEVALGEADDLAGKAENLHALLRQAPPAEPSRIDLRYRDMVVVKDLDRTDESEE